MNKHGNIFEYIYIYVCVFLKERVDVKKSIWERVGRNMKITFRMGQTQWALTMGLNKRQKQHGGIWRKSLKS